MCVLVEHKEVGARRDARLRTGTRKHRGDRLGGQENLQNYWARKKIQELGDARAKAQLQHKPPDAKE